MDSEQYKHLCDKVELVLEQQGILNRAVLGEEKAGNRGLINRVALLESWRVNIDLRIAAYVGFGMGATFVIRYFLKGSI